MKEKASTPPPNLTGLYRQELKGVAIIGIMLFHRIATFVGEIAGYLFAAEKCSLRLTLFILLISGFLLQPVTFTVLYERASRHRNRPFYFRRVRRIPCPRTSWL